MSIMKSKITIGICVVTLIATVIGCNSEQPFADSMNHENTITSLTYKIVETGQTTLYSNSGELREVSEGDSFYGQDGSYITNEISYTDNGDGTITDNTTGLMWQSDAGVKKSYDDAIKDAENSALAGYDDWRMASIKELYSLINFTGKTGMSASTSTPYIDEGYFQVYYGDTTKGERFIDAQYMSSTKYVGKTMNSDATVFGVNFIDGRIKGYGLTNPRTRTDNKFYSLMVRGNTAYGNNNFVDNGDGTITDLATGLMWATSDSQIGMDWEDALEYAENSNLAGYSDWKLPDAKELQSLVDYSKSPQTTDTPAIDDVFETTSIIDEGNGENYPFYWSSTTHLDGRNLGSAAVYVAFGEALGFMDTPKTNGPELMDVHGAGAQRSDPKTGSAEDYPNGFGPQGDVRRVDNFVRLVRLVDITELEASNALVGNVSQNEVIEDKTIDFSELKGLGAVLIGTGGPKPSEERSSPSTLVYLNDHYFLVDMGEGTQDRLYEAGLNTGDIETLMFTHHHLDHNEEYSGILINGWLKGRNHLNLMGPEFTKMLHEFTSDFYKEDMAYRASNKKNWSWDGIFENVDVYEFDGYGKKVINGVTITTLAVPHTIATQAYRFEYEDTSIVVSGDLSYSDNLITLAHDVDYLIMDSGSVIKEGSNGKGIAKATSAHSSLIQVAEMAEKSRAKNLVLTHIGGDIDADAQISEISKLYKGNIIVGEDLMVVGQQLIDK